MAEMTGCGHRASYRLDVPAMLEAPGEEIARGEGAMGAAMALGDGTPPEPLCSLSA